MWSVNKLTAEQVLGQVLQLMQEMDKRVKELESRADAQQAFCLYLQIRVQ